MANSLIHYGIKGMKWGVRRYQNSDGTYTDEGKRRRNYSSDYTSTQSLRKKSYKELSNSELKELNRRLNLESEYKRLNASTSSKAYTAAKTFVGVTGTISAIYAVRNAEWVRAGASFLKALIV